MATTQSPTYTRLRIPSYSPYTSITQTSTPTPTSTSQSPSPSLSPIKKFLIAKVARERLASESALRDHNLRKLVGHAHIVDRFLAERETLPAYQPPTLDRVNATRLIPEKLSSEWEDVDAKTDPTLNSSREWNVEPSLSTRCIDDERRIENAIEDDDEDEDEDEEEENKSDNQKSQDTHDADSKWDEKHATILRYFEFIPGDEHEHELDLDIDEHPNHCDSSEETENERDRQKQREKERMLTRDGVGSGGCTTVMVEIAEVEMDGGDD